jgi:hypothetical protein
MGSKLLIALPNIYYAGAGIFLAEIQVPLEIGIGPREHLESFCRVC